MFHSHIIVSSDKNAQETFIAGFIKDHEIHHIDVSRLTNESVTIADVRLLIISLSRAPYASPCKIAVINGDGITPEAQQALLKTLEEPPPRTFLLISVASIDTLLPTIVSRTTVTMLSSEKIDGEIENASQNETFWKKIFKTSIGSRMEITSSLTKNREELTHWLEEQIIWNRQELLNFYIQSDNPTLPAVSLYRQLMENLQKARLSVQKNISLKLVIDHLFIKLPYITVM